MFLLKLCIGWFLLERDLDFKCMEKKILKRKYYDDDDELEIKYLNSKPQIEVRYFRNLKKLLFRGLIKLNRNELHCSFQAPCKNSHRYSMNLSKKIEC